MLASLVTEQENLNNIKVSMQEKKVISLLVSIKWWPAAEGYNATDDAQSVWRSNKQVDIRQSCFHVSH